MNLADMVISKRITTLTARRTFDLIPNLGSLKYGLAGPQIKRERAFAPATMGHGMVPLFDDCGNHRYIGGSPTIPINMIPLEVKSESQRFGSPRLAGGAFLPCPGPVSYEFVR
jgi:hypothetical protein